MSDDLNFHYKREDRLSMRSAPQPRPSGPGLFRRRRGSPMLFFNVLLIAVLLIVYGRSLTRGSYRADIAGCEVTLNALAAGDDVMAVLEIKGGPKAEEGERLFAVFRAGEAELRLSGVLPAAEGTVAVGGRIIGAGPAREVVVEVSVGPSSKVLRRTLVRG